MRKANVPKSKKRTNTTISGSRYIRREPEEEEEAPRPQITIDDDDQEEREHHPEIAIYAGGPGAARTPPSVVESYRPAPAPAGPPAARGSSKGWILPVGLLALGLAAFAGYWFFYRHKYGVGAVLQHSTEPMVSYQVTELKYSGITHIYVLSKDLTETVEYAVKDLDNDPDWVQIA